MIVFHVTRFWTTASRVIGGLSSSPAYPVEAKPKGGRCLVPAGDYQWLLPEHQHLVLARPRLPHLTSSSAPDSICTICTLPFAFSRTSQPPSSILASAFPNPSPVSRALLTFSPSGTLQQNTSIPFGVLVPPADSLSTPLWHTPSLSLSSIVCPKQFQRPCFVRISKHCQNPILPQSFDSTPAHLLENCGIAIDNNRRSGLDRPLLPHIYLLDTADISFPPHKPRPSTPVLLDHLYDFSCQPSTPQSPQEAQKNHSQTRGIPSSLSLSSCSCHST